MTKLCPICGLEFSVRPSRSHTRRFCSRRCQAAHYRTLTGPLCNHWKGFGPDVIRTRNTLREAARRAVYSDPEFDHVVWESIKAEYEYRCAACLAPETEDSCLTIDHIVPLSRGGVHERANVQPLCFTCNVRKHIRIIYYTSGFEVVDLDALPQEFLRPSRLKILAALQASNGSIQIPGVRAFSRRVPAVKA